MTSGDILVGRHRADRPPDDGDTTTVARHRRDDAALAAAWVSDDQDEPVREVLERTRALGSRVLHDRRVSGSRERIDHLVVTSAGVWVVAAAHTTARPRRTVEGGRLRARREHLHLGLRDRTGLLEVVRQQAALVSAVVGDDVPVHATLCLVGADWPLLTGDFTVRDVLVTWPRRLHAALSLETGGPVDVATVHSRLNAAFRVV